MERKVEFLAIKDMKAVAEEIYYCGNSELEAYKVYRGIKGAKRNIVMAEVKKDTFMDMDFIIDYEVINIIK